MVLRATIFRGFYCLLYKIGARKPTICFLVSFAAQRLVRVSIRAYKHLEGVPGNVTCREITCAIQPINLIANFTKNFDKRSK